ncbi:MAG: hypothetical protein R3A44_01155 [Caldilineaceae bacterium]
MNRIVILFMTVCGLLVGLSTVVLSKGIVRSLLPMIVDVAQVVPVEAVIVDEKGITSTVPLTMTVNVQVRLDGIQLASTQVMTQSEPIALVRSVKPEVAPGDPVINNVWWTVENVERLGTKMELRDLDHLKFDTRGEFVMLHMALKNVGSEPIEIGRAGQFSKSFDVNLMDKEDRSFSPFNVGYVLDELCENIDVNPGVEVPCLIPFEVAERASGFMLRVTNDTSDVIEVPVVE